MNSTFKAAVSQFIREAPPLTHTQRVCRLYRRALKLTYSWAVFRPIFVKEAEKLRAKFDANAGLDPHSKKASLLCEKGEALLVEYAHPDNYVPPHMPGGTLYMRNPPLPRAVVYNYDVPEGLPEEELLNPDWTWAKPGEKGNSGQVYVDFSTKKMY